MFQPLFKVCNCENGPLTSYLFGLQVVEEDPLPKAVCFRCLYNLENFYDFRTICINALSMLQRCLPPEFEVSLFQFYTQFFIKIN